MPPAVFKITSYSHSAAAVWSRFAYISREGELEAGGPAGERYALEELEQVLAEGEGKRRLAMRALVTFPRGTDAARAFFAEAFADNHDSVLAGPRATANFHVHIVVQARGHDGKQIRIGRADIQDLRLLFAEKAAEQGIALDASPRWARGEEQARGAGAAVEGMRRRWRRPELELAGAVLPSPTRREQLEALIEVRRDRDPAAAGSPLEYARPGPWDACQALEYAKTAGQAAVQLGELKTDPDRVAAGRRVGRHRRGRQRWSAVHLGPAGPSAPSPATPR